MPRSSREWGGEQRRAGSGWRAGTSGGARGAGEAAERAGEGRFLRGVPPDGPAVSDPLSPFEPAGRLPPDHSVVGLTYRRMKRR